MAAVDRVNPSELVKNCLHIEKKTSREESLVIKLENEEHVYRLSDYDRIFAIGFGKASARMALGLEAVLEDRLFGGIIAVKEGHTEKLNRLSIMEAGHPVPDERSIRAAEAMLGLGDSLGQGLTDRDLVIVLVSGGGSAILCSPAPGLKLQDKSVVTKQLLASGAAIHEVNCVRKHLSGIKGGRLAAALAPATLLALVLSDVVGDDLDAIASGPTVPDPSSFDDAVGIIRRYGLEEALPKAAMQHLLKGQAGLVPDSPKPGDAAFIKAKTLVVGSNRLALLAAEAKAKQLGYNSLLLTSRLEGEAREAAMFFLAMAKDIAVSGFPAKKPACLIAGGETTVTLKGSGKGGRNQEMALAFLAALGRNPKDGNGLTFLSAGTDGNDGPTDAAGAAVSLELYERAVMQGLKPEAALANNDSYSFFEKAGGHIKTGPTNTNVCDIQLLLVT